MATKYLSNITYSLRSLPSKDYKTLTLRNEIHDRIIAAVHKAKKKNRRMYTSEFIEMLLDSYEKKSS
jgi:molybdenum cofactor biosynthesis enzyme MoaA